MSTTKPRVTLYDKTFELMIPSERITQCVASVAERINQDYADRATPPVILGVLNGSFMFAADLASRIEFGCEVQFVKIASYEGSDSSGVVRELIGLNGSIEGRDVIIVEDIVDTGRSIAHLMTLLEKHRVASIAVATMFFKPKAYKEQYPIQYPAMEIGNEFIVGYGLDYNQLGRNLKDIYVIVNE